MYSKLLCTIFSLVLYPEPTKSLLLGMADCSKEKIDKKSYKLQPNLHNKIMSKAIKPVKIFTIMATIKQGQVSNIS